MTVFTGCVNGSRLAHPVTTHYWLVRRWVKSGDQIELVKSVLRFRSDLDVVLLDLWQLGTVLVVVAVRVAALDADGFHGVGELGVNRRACRIASVAWYLIMLLIGVIAGDSVRASRRKTSAVR